MRIDRKNRHDERLILIGLIVDEAVLGRITAKWQRGLFRTRWTEIIANWCVKYYAKYQKAPMHHIENMYRSWADKQQNKELVRLIEKFLDSLSQEYEQLKEDTNTDYIIDTAGRYFNEVQLENLAEQIQGDIDNDESDKAKQRVTAFKQVELGGGEGINVLQDKAAIKQAFADKKESLIKYPGALGKFFKDALERDALVAFLGPEKRGKTFWLLDIAYRAMLQRRRVVYFEAGDMSQNQVMRRLMTRVSSSPIYPQKVRFPVSIKKRREIKIASLKTKIKKYKKPLNWKLAKKYCDRLMKKKIRSQQPLFKLSCHPNSTLTVGTIRSILQSWENDGWAPDVIVIDYADIMNMESQGLEGRDRINELWKQLRALSQEYHCSVVTATQADANAYEAKTINMKNFSEDKRKFAHVTGMVGLNAIEAEKRRDIIRLNWIVLRESRFNVNKCVHVAGCLALGRPAIVSCF